MKRILFSTIFAALLLCACSDNGSTKSCVRQAYCIKSTDHEMECDLNPEITKAKKEQYTAAGTFEEAHEECWDF